MTIVAFFSTRRELNVLERRKDFKSLCLIALTPEADVALDKYPERKKTVEDYYSEIELNRVGNSSLEKIQEICDYIDQHCIPLKHFFSCSDVLMFIKVLYDQLLINHTFCYAIFMEERPQKILFFNLKPLSETLFPALNDDLLAHSIHYFFRTKKKVECEVLSCQEPVSITQTNHRPLCFIKNKLSRFKFKLENKCYRFLNFTKPATYMLQHYDFEACKNLRTAFKLYWDPKKENNVSYQIEPINLSLKKMDKESLDIYFTFDNISYAALINSKLNFLIQKLPVLFNQRVSYYLDFYSRKKIKAVIAASGQSLDILAGIKAARINKIPVVWGQHGGFYGYASFPLMEYLHKNYTHYFLYTEDIAVINKNINCFSVSDSHLLEIYKAKRHAH
ncbi:MAG: hypothetical protein K2X53_02250 [Alphaproteobacteria bacterium]|nr:hypothetical protein [Alphaproteobacteria bacterium]